MYNNFPPTIQRLMIYNHQNSNAQLTQMKNAIAQALYQINQETYDLKTLTKSSPPHCELNLEFGIAEQDSFTFLGKEELERYQRILKAENEPIDILDFFCAARYHSKQKNGKRSPLKFDYTLLRYRFYHKAIELSMSHQRGNQRLPLEDLAAFLTKKINYGLTGRGLDTLNLTSVKPP